MECLFDSEPLKPGWYPVRICYDPMEGVFPDGAYWDGSEWSRRAVICFFELSCETEERARELAYFYD